MGDEFDGSKNVADLIVVPEHPIDRVLDHAIGALEAQQKSITLNSLELAEHAKYGATKLKADFPGVVFTSGRRSVSQQATAMAKNIVLNRNWIKETYKASSERDELQKWVENNPSATSQAVIASGLEAIMAKWSDLRRIKISRHFAGLAFDVRPSADEALKQAIKNLPNCIYFTDIEGGLTIWHAEFSAP